MSVPAKDEFGLVLDLFSSFNAKEIEGNVDNIEFDYHAIRNFYLEVYTAIGEKRSIINKAIVMKWLKQDYPYQRGLEAIFGKKAANLSQAEWNSKNIELATAQAQWVIDSYKYIDNEEFLLLVTGKDIHSGDYSTRDGYFVSGVDEYNNSRFTQQLRKDAGMLVGRWMNDFISALKSYYYDEQYFERHLKGNCNLDATKKILDAMISLDELISGGDTHLFALRHALDIDIAATKKEYEIQKAFKKPIKNNDKTVRERVLCYQLWQGLKRQGADSKSAAAITWFLQIEGISHQLDMRTVQRNLSQWRGDSKDYEEHAKAIQSKYEVTSLDWMGS